MFMNFNCSMPALITSLALALAPQLSSSELSLVAAALTQLGDTFATIAAEREFCEDQDTGTGTDEP